MQVKIQLDTGEIGKTETITVSYSDWHRYADKSGDITLYKKIPIYGYELIQEETDLPEKKNTPKETVKQWLARRKTVKCKYKGCDNIGLHLGDLCATHYEKAWRYMRKEKINYAEFIRRLNEKRKEKNAK